MSDDFGEAYYTALSAQKLNPAAPVNPTPANSLPGELAEKIYQQRYVKSLTEKQESEDSVDDELGD